MKPMEVPVAAAAARGAGRRLGVLLVSEHASARFGGEAALGLHYFRVLRERDVNVWLVTHARTREELARLFGDDPRIHYVEDTRAHRVLWRLGRRLPARLAHFTLGFLSRLLTQREQRRLVRRLVAQEQVDVIHQPMPVSPREPSTLHGFGVPVVIGPMNGGMRYPPGFAQRDGVAGRVLLAAGRAASEVLNRLLPGKREAALLLVANPRTREALPRCAAPRVAEVVENGVDLRLWAGAGAPTAGDGPATFVFMGRLVALKCVDVLLEAFANAAARVPMRLVIVGDGPEREHLQGLAGRLNLIGHAGGDDPVRFTGWLPQAECAAQLRAADALVLPSVHECGGAVVLEAMAMGRPVIAVAWGGPADYIDASCGVLVAPTDRGALRDGFAEAMQRLAASPETRLALGRAGREKIVRDFDWEVKVDHMLARYHELARARALHAG